MPELFKTIFWTVIVILAIGQLLTLAWTLTSVVMMVDQWADARRIKYRHQEACYREAERRARRESKDYY